MKALLPLLALTVTLSAQSPVRVPYECSEGDADAFGLNCSTEEPCAIFLELTGADSNGGRLLVTGNLHTREVTLYGVLLASEDGGATWTEPQARVRAAALEQIEFADPQNGWVSGESIDPLARNPFFLLTNDGGKTWRNKPVFDDEKFGTIAQFHFESKDSGQFVLDASQGKARREELYESMTGGESWELKQVSPALKLSSPRKPALLRVRVDAASGTYRLERPGAGKTEPVASFVIHLADCQ